MSNDANKIISRYEDIGRVLTDYSTSIKNFVSDADGICGRIESTYLDRSIGWEGKTYDEFVGNMNAKLATIRESLSSLSSLTRNLDNSAAQIAKILSQLQNKLK